MDAVKEFNDGAIPWLDELYDLTKRAPHEKGFRIKQVIVSPLSVKSGKGNFSTRMEITGVVDGSKTRLVQQLMKEINKDKYCFCRTILLTDRTKKNSTATEEDFKLMVEIARRPSSQYTERLVPPPLPAGAAKLQSVDDDQ